MDSEFVKGVDQVVQNLSSRNSQMMTEIVAGCEAVQQKVITAAQIRVPVITHHLQESIRPTGIIVTDDNVQALIGALAEYASYVEGVPDELGRIGRGRKTPYLGPSVLENQGVFVKAMEAAVRRALA